MELCQRGDWRAVRHMAVRFDDADAISRLEYTWVQMFDIEKRIPTTVTLTGPGCDGAFRIPVESAAIPCSLYIVLRAVYTDGGDDYGLVTTKHFSDTYTETKGHKVKRVSVLARAPLAWVMMNSPPVTAASRENTYPFTGDALRGHQPEMLVCRIYAAVNRHVRAAFVSTSSFAPGSTEGDGLASEVVSDTLSTLGAPLAFKVLHEQSRLTLERSREREDPSDVSAIPDPRSAPWGTCVLWQLDRDRDTLSRASVNRETDLLPTVPSSDPWLRVRLTRVGLEVTRYSGRTSVEDVVEAPYWAVVLAALCCGALDRWSQELHELHAPLRVDRNLLSSDRESGELCQRCGYAYGVSPVACDPEPKRVPAVSQIDKLLLGGICTTLCATVPGNTVDARIVEGAGSEEELVPRGRARGAARESRYCLNHRRAYRASCEEKRDRERRRGEQREELREREAREREQKRRERERLTGPRAPYSKRQGGARANQIASWWKDESRCYWGQGQEGREETEEEEEEEENRYGPRQIAFIYRSDKDREGEEASARRRGGGEEEENDKDVKDDEEEERQREKRTRKNRETGRRDEDAGLWSWQKDCRDERRKRLGRREGQTSHRRRFWELYYQLSGSQKREGDESGSRSFTAMGYWKRFTCQVLRYHIKTLPFGHRGGLLDF